MSEKRDLNHDESVQKLKTMAENKPCMFTTFKDAYKLDSRPMITQEVDEKGIMWFFGDLNSFKIDQLKVHNSVELVYMNTNTNSFLYVAGVAIIKKDQEMIDKLWKPALKVWFDGPKDPNLVLLKVEPRQAHYWETINGKLVAGLKMLFASITGATTDLGREGELSVQSNI